MRNFTVNPARKIIKAAVQAVRNDVTRSPVMVNNTVLAAAGTTPATDGEGNIIGTIHVAVTELDSTNTGAVTGGW